MARQKTAETRAVAKANADRARAEVAGPALLAAAGPLADRLERDTSFQVSAPRLLLTLTGQEALALIMAVGKARGRDV